MRLTVLDNGNSCNESGNKFQTTGIIVYVLAPDTAESHATSNTCVIGCESADCAKVAAGGGAWRSHGGPEISGHMRGQGLQIRLFSK